MTTNLRRFLCIESIRHQITERKKVMTFTSLKGFFLWYFSTGIILIALLYLNDSLNPLAPEGNVFWSFPRNWKLEATVLLLLLWPIIYLYYFISLLIHFLPPNTTSQIVNLSILGTLLITPLHSFFISEVAYRGLSRSRIGDVKLINSMIPDTP